MSAQPEDSPSPPARPLEITLYTRPGCHLCEDAKALLLPLLNEFRAALTEVNIDGDKELTELYGLDIPVLFIGSHKAAKHKVDLRQFRRQLEEARARGGSRG